MRRLKLSYIPSLFLLLILLLVTAANAQDCSQQFSKKTNKIYKKALSLYGMGKKREARELMFQLTKSEPNFAKAQFSLGEFYILNKPPKVSTARKYFERAIQLCPDSVLYAYYYMGKIFYGGREYEKAIECFEYFLQDVDKIRTDEDYYEIKNYLDYARVSYELISHPVAFKPEKIEGISTTDDEYLPIISPDNELALFTRRSKHYVSKGLTERLEEKEVFTFSLRNPEGSFEQGWELQHPFNKADNEGAATLTIDNNDLYYTVCTRNPETDYLNCDLYHSHFARGYWSDIKSLGDNVNGKQSWESQPSVTSNGNTIYFASNREGGIGGYDIYMIHKLSYGQWTDPINLGPVINTVGNEKSPFIHTDSQTLYFSSDGHKGLGGYDIFYSRQNPDQSWQTPINIGYPINYFDDDLGFFVSTDGQYGYFASNRFDKNNKWNLYSFPLYEEAQPQKVLFIKGKIEVNDTTVYASARIQLKNMRTKTITQIPIDSVTGKYVAAILFKDDQVLTVKKEGFVYSSRYLSVEDTTLQQPKKIDIDVKEIKVGEAYRINDIHFATNKATLTKDAEKILEEFYEFLSENPQIEVEIQGHTDNVGREKDNLILSDKRAKEVYLFLVKKGIDASRLEANGYGESQAVCDNTTAKNRARNRRTVFVIKKK